MILKEEIIIRLIKCIDISLIGIYYLFFGIILSLIINFVIGSSSNIKNKKKLKKKLYLLKRIVIRTSLIMISIYFIRQIIKRIPFPLEGFYGYDSKRVKELQGGVIVSFSILSLQSDYLIDIKNLINLITK